ncbi:hypothetical protein LT330_000618 [Penicillium expansum]|nr:hypothetical protein LT330_000618 [Penicillium expansum]
MAETRSSPEVINASLPALEVQHENKFKDYNFSDITHVVVHLSDITIRNIQNMMNSKSNTSNEYENKGYLEIIGKMLSLTFFGNENQLEYLDTEHVGRRKFVAFTNIQKKEKPDQSQSPSHEKLQVIEVIFMRTNPRETLKIFWRPARAIVFQRVLTRVKKLLEMAMDVTIPENKPAEQLFLDLPIQDVLNKNAGMLVIEPWASIYVDAIRDGRFVDAVWARYHISGDLENEIAEDPNNMTVLDVIKVDALEYRVNEPEEYAKALSFYAKTSSADGHADVIETIDNLTEKDIARVRAQLEAECEDGLSERTRAHC